MKDRPSAPPVRAPDSAIASADSVASPTTPLPNTPEAVAELRRALATTEGRLIIALQQNGVLRREQARLRQEVAHLTGKTERSRVIRFARVH